MALFVAKWKFIPKPSCHKFFLETRVKSLTFGLLFGRIFSWSLMDKEGIMERSRLVRSSLIEVLMADRSWSPTMIDPSYVGGAVTSEIWQLVLADLAQIQADRLLGSPTSGSLLDRLTVRQKMIEVGVLQGAFQIPGMPVRVTMSIATSMADVHLVMSPIDLVETYAERWERLKAILAASQVFNMEPTRFLREYDGAQEYILRLSSSPDEFRAHQTERVDAKHPEIVSRYIQTLHDALCEEAIKQLGRHNVDIRVLVSFPVGEDYWQMRTWWLQAIELQIARVWPDQALGNQHAPADDA